jgi:hypothetical protein
MHALVYLDTDDRWTWRLVDARGDHEPDPQRFDTPALAVAAALATEPGLDVRVINPPGPQEDVRQGVPLP